MDFTGRATSTTASSWAWALGRLGLCHGWGGHRFVNDGGGNYRGAASHCESQQLCPWRRSSRTQHQRIALCADSVLQAEQGQQQVMPRFNVAAAVVVKFGWWRRRRPSPGRRWWRWWSCGGGGGVMKRRRPQVTVAAAQASWVVLRRGATCSAVLLCSSVSAVRSVC